MPRPLDQTQQLFRLDWKTSMYAGALPKDCYTDHAYGLEGMARKARELFTENLNALMASAGFKSPGAVAERLEIDRTRVWSWTKGKSFPEVDQLDALAKLFGVHVSRFFMDLKNPKTSGIDLDVVAATVTEAIQSLRDRKEDDDG